MMSDAAIQFENFQALAFVQATLGALSRNVRCASIRCLNGEVELFYVLEIESAEDREEIDDIEAEMYSHQSNGSIVVNAG